MLHREERNGILAIAQPAHAWVSGQLARAWGNDRFGPVEPREPVCQAAADHDVGWLAWEQAPTLNPETGRPHTFMELPRAAHLDLWTAARGWALTQGRYIALLVSRHGSGLYARHDPGGDPPEEARAIRAFLETSHAFEECCLATLRQDSVYAPCTEPGLLSRNQRLIAVWDYLSLLLCGGLHAPRTVENVPDADAGTVLSLTPLDGNPDRIAVDPWPFLENRVVLLCEGRRLTRTFTDEARMQAALRTAPWVTLEIRLTPT